MTIVTVYGMPSDALNVVVLAGIGKHYGLVWY